MCSIKTWLKTHKLLAGILAVLLAAGGAYYAGTRAVVVPRVYAQMDELLAQAETVETEYTLYWDFHQTVSGDRARELLQKLRRQIAWRAQPFALNQHCQTGEGALVVRDRNGVVLGKIEFYGNDIFISTGVWMSSEDWLKDKRVLYGFFAPDFQGLTLVISQYFPAG